MRRASEADAERLFAAHRASVQAFCAASYPPEQMRAWFEGRTPEIYRPWLEAGRIWLAEGEPGGEVLGFVGFEPGEVTLLFVRPGAAGTGIGSALFRFGLERAAAGFDGPVMVLATLNARRFYERHGFVKVEDCAFERGSPPLRYEVVKMLRQPSHEGD